MDHESGESTGEVEGDMTGAKSDMYDCVVVRIVPARIYELRNITRNEDLPASLVCRSHGDPAPDMKFRKMGSPYEFNATNVRCAPN